MKYLKLRHPVLSSAAFIIGTAIGAGIFAIPAAIAKIGFTLGVFYLAILGVVSTLTLLAYTEVVLRTRERKQLAGYAGHYLGDWGKAIMAFAFVVGFSGALTAYVLGVSELLQALLGGDVTFWASLFLILAGVAVAAKLKSIATIEGWLVVVLLSVVGLLAIFGLPKIEVGNLAIHSIRLRDLIIPWGVILFAYGALAAIPDAVDLIGRERKKIFKAVLLGMGIPAAVYFVFSFLMVGLVGANVPDNALIGLWAVGPWLFVLGAAFGIITMSTSFLTISTALREVYLYDFKMPHWLAWVAVMAPPVVFGLTRATTFLEVIGLAGAIMGGLEGIIVLLMWERARIRKGEEPPFRLRITPLFADFLIVLYLIGMIGQLWLLWQK